MLIIANANYLQPGRLKPSSRRVSVPALGSPLSDAAALKKAFREHGDYTVTVVTDLTLPGMRRAVNDWADTLRAMKPTDRAVIVYAGHGVQIAGDPLMLPVDINLQECGSIADMQGVCYSLRNLVASVRERCEKAQPLVVLYDACQSAVDRAGGDVRGTPPSVRYERIVSVFAHRVVGGPEYLPYVLLRAGTSHSRWWQRQHAVRGSDLGAAAACAGHGARLSRD
jgi:hypothetical protein